MRKTIDTRDEDTEVDVSHNGTTVFLYIISGEGVRLAMLTREQAHDIAFALLGDDAAPSPFTDDEDRSVRCPTCELEFPDAIALADHINEQDGIVVDPTLDAPAWVDEDDPYDPYTIGGPTLDPLVETVANTFAAGDQQGFERGYAQAVEDYRHGLFADEEETATRALSLSRFNETSLRTTLIDVRDHINASLDATPPDTKPCLVCGLPRSECRAGNVG